MRPQLARKREDEVHLLAQPKGLTCKAKAQPAYVQNSAKLITRVDCVERAIAFLSATSFVTST